MFSARLRELVDLSREDETINVHNGMQSSPKQVDLTYKGNKLFGLAECFKGDLKGGSEDDKKAVLQAWVSCAKNTKGLGGALVVELCGGEWSETVIREVLSTLIVDQSLNLEECFDEKTSESQYDKIADSLVQASSSVPPKVLLTLVHINTIRSVFQTTNDSTRALLCKVILRLVTSGYGLEACEQEIQRHAFDNFKNVYVLVIEELRKTDNRIWYQLCMFTLKYFGKLIHNDIELLNSLLSNIEHGFKSKAVEDKILSFNCWKVLIDISNLDHAYLCSTKQLKLLVKPLKVKLSRSDQVTCKRLEVWMHLLTALQEDCLACLEEFMNFCFDVEGPVIKSTWSKRLEVLMSFIGHCNPGDCCIHPRTFKLDNPVINNTNILKYKNVTLNAIRVCSENILSCDVKSNREEKIKCLWGSLFRNVGKLHDLDKELILHDIFGILKKFMKKSEEDGCQDYFDDIIQPIFTIISTLDNQNCDYLVFNEIIIFPMAQLMLSYPNIPEYRALAFIQLLRSCSKTGSRLDYFNRSCELLKSYSFNKTQTLSSYIWLELANELLTICRSPKDEFEAFKSSSAFLMCWICECQIPKHLEEMILNKWCSIMTEIDVICEEFKEIPLGHFEKLLKTNPTIASNVLAFLPFVIDRITEKSSLSYVTKVTDVVLECLKNPCLKSDKIMTVLPIILKASTNISKSDTNESEPLGLKLFECVEYFLKPHQVYQVLKTFKSIIPKLPQSLKQRLSSNLLTIVQDLTIHTDSVIAQDAISLVAEIDKQEPIKKPTFAKPIVSKRTEKIASMTSAGISQNQSLNLFAQAVQKSPISVKGSVINNMNQRNSRIMKIANAMPSFKKQNNIDVDGNSSDFVYIDSEVKVDYNKMVSHQKEVLRKRKEDIPALYQDLSQSQHSNESLSKSNDSVTPENIKSNKTFTDILDNIKKNDNPLIGALSDKPKIFEKCNKTQRKSTNGNIVKLKEKSSGTMNPSVITLKNKVDTDSKENENMETNDEYNLDIEGNSKVIAKQLITENVETHNTDNPKMEGNLKVRDEQLPIENENVETNDTDNLNIEDNLNVRDEQLSRENENVETHDAHNLNMENNLKVIDEQLIRENANVESRDSNNLNMEGNSKVIDEQLTRANENVETHNANNLNVEGNLKVLLERLTKEKQNHLILMDKNDLEQNNRSEYGEEREENKKFSESKKRNVVSKLHRKTLIQEQIDGTSIETPKRMTRLSLSCIKKRGTPRKKRSLTMEINKDLNCTNHDNINNSKISKEDSLNLKVVESVDNVQGQCTTETSNTTGVEKNAEEDEENNQQESSLGTKKITDEENNTKQKVHNVRRKNPPRKNITKSGEEKNSVDTKENEATPDKHDINKENNPDKHRLVTKENESENESVLKDKEKQSDIQGQQVVDTSHNVDVEDKIEKNVDKEKNMETSACKQKQKYRSKIRKQNNKDTERPEENELNSKKEMLQIKDSENGFALKSVMIRNRVNVTRNSFNNKIRNPFKNKITNVLDKQLSDMTECKDSNNGGHKSINDKKLNKIVNDDKLEKNQTEVKPFNDDKNTSLTDTTILSNTETHNQPNTESLGTEKNEKPNTDTKEDSEINGKKMEEISIQESLEEQDSNMKNQVIKLNTNEVSQIKLTQNSNQCKSEDIFNTQEMRKIEMVATDDPDTTICSEDNARTQSERNKQITFTREMNRLRMDIVDATKFINVKRKRSTRIALPLPNKRKRSVSIEESDAKKPRRKEEPQETVKQKKKVSNTKSDEDVTNPDEEPSQCLLSHGKVISNDKKNTSTLLSDAISENQENLMNDDLPETNQKSTVLKMGPLKLAATPKKLNEDEIKTDNFDNSSADSKGKLYTEFATFVSIEDINTELNELSSEMFSSSFGKKKDNDHENALSPSTKEIKESNLGTHSKQDLEPLKVCKRSRKVSVERKLQVNINEIMQSSINPQSPEIEVITINSDEDIVESSQPPPNPPILQTPKSASKMFKSADLNIDIDSEAPSISNKSQTSQKIYRKSTESVSRTPNAVNLILNIDSETTSTNNISKVSPTNYKKNMTDCASKEGTSRLSNNADLIINIDSEPLSRNRRSRVSPKSNINNNKDSSFTGNAVNTAESVDWIVNIDSETPNTINRSKLSPKNYSKGVIDYATIHNTPKTSKSVDMVLNIDSEDLSTNNSKLPPKDCRKTIIDCPSVEIIPPKVDDTLTCNSDISIVSIEQVSPQCESKKVLTNVLMVLDLNDLPTGLNVADHQNLPGSPISEDISNRNSELLNSTIDISPIKLPQDQNNQLEKLETSTSLMRSPSSRSLLLMNLIPPGVKTTKLPKSAHKRTPLNVSSPSTDRVRKMMMKCNGTTTPDNANAKNEEVEIVNVLEFKKDVPSPFATPNRSILKRKAADALEYGISPFPKRKRVNFSDPPITAEKIYFKDQEEDSLDVISTLSDLSYKKSSPIYPSLVNCLVDVNEVLANLKQKNVQKNFSSLDIKTVGDLAKLTSTQVNQLEFLNNPKLSAITTALSVFAEKYNRNERLDIPESSLVPTEDASLPVNGDTENNALPLSALDKLRQSDAGVSELWNELKELCTRQQLKFIFEDLKELFSTK